MNYNKPLSYSGIKLFKKCPRLWADSYILMNKRPSDPAADRGTFIHKKLEDFFLGKPYPDELVVLRPWKLDFTDILRHRPSTEAELAVKVDWTPTSFEDPEALVRGKADLIFQEENVLHIYDFKTGRKYPDHEEQGRTYFALSADKVDKVEKCIVSMVYLDQLEVDEQDYYPNELKESIEWVKEDAMRIRTATSYDPTPSMDTCKHCHLSWRKGGTCGAAP